MLLIANDNVIINGHMNKKVLKNDNKMIKFCAAELMFGLVELEYRLVL